MSRDHDLILTWLSASETPPSRARIDEAYRFLEMRGADARAVFEDLHRLGHVEREGSQSWRVVAPTLLWHAERGVGHVYGARTSRLFDILRSEFGERLRETDSPDGPRLWSVTGDTADVRSAAERLSLRMQRERGEELLAALPTLDTTLRDLPRELAPPRLRREWQRFERGSWPPFPVGRAPEVGLYRPVERPGAAWLDVVPSRTGLLEAVFLDTSDLRAIGMCRELVRQGEVRLIYDRARRELGVSRAGETRLPVLLDRALRLASGRSPTHDREAEVVTYSDISRRRARLAARILGLTLEIRR